MEMTSFSSTKQMLKNKCNYQIHQTIRFQTSAIKRMLWIQVDMGFRLINLELLSKFKVDST